MSKYADIIDRLGNAQGRDRELDAAIAVAVDGFHEFPPAWEGGPLNYAYYEADGTMMLPGNGGDQLVPKYTASIDAALALVERLLPGFDWILGRTNDGLTIHCQLGGPFMHFGATPALAVLVSLFRHLDAEATQ